MIKGDHVKQDLTFCCLPDFAGGYSAEFHGTTNSPKDLAGRFQRIGRLVADGNGRFTASTVASYNGRVIPENISGTYCVSSKRHVTLRYAAPAAASSEAILINGVIGGHGEIVQMMILNDGWGVAGSLLRQQN